MTVTQELNAAQRVTKAIEANGLQVVPTYTNAAPTQIDINAPAGAGGATIARMNLSFDSRGRLYSASDLVGTVAQFKYDKNGNGTRVRDGRNNTVSLAFGPANEPTGLTWAGGQTVSLAYDAAGRIRQFTDERAIVRTYAYDTAHRLQNVQFPAHSTQNVAYQYDLAGRPTLVTDSTGSGLPPNQNTVR